MLRRLSLAAIALAILATSLQTASTADAVPPINFTRGILAGSGFSTSAPTTMAFGPDGRLYVSDGSGRIQALTLDANTKAVTAVQQITTASDLQEVYGIAFDPADGSMWVTNTVSGFGDAGQAPAGSFLGKVTRLSGPNFATRADIITGLPVNNSGHQANGLAFGADGRLYIGQGSTTNAGVINPSGFLFQRDEVVTSSAILVADVHAPGFDGNITYSPANTYAASVVQTGGLDVQVYASGLRNPYDIVFHSNGRLYNTDNGPNAGYGPGSLTCSTDDGADANAPDELNIIEPGKYYGHPNRARGTQIPDAAQCDYRAGTEPGSGNYVAPIGLLPPSSDGLAEYTSSTFAGQMQGDLLYVSWVDNTLHRVKLDPGGGAVQFDVTLATGLTQALDVVTAADGTIYVAEYGANRVTFFKPDESPVSGITVTNVAPGVGPTGGGQTITITGTNFTIPSETTVLIDGIAATNITVQNSTTMTAVTPAHAGTGQVDVSVSNSVGSATLVNGYAYSDGGGVFPPVADAGPDWSGPIAHNDHAHAILDGSASYDPDFPVGDVVAWEWKEGTTVLSNQEVDSIEFQLGDHLVTLTVTDNDGNTATDDVRIIVTQFAENPEPYYCFDVNADTRVNVIDLQQVASQYGKRYGDAGYTRLKDWNADRIINVIDLQGTAADIAQYAPVAGVCPQLDQQIRAATAGIEQYQNINNAIAAGYIQATPYIPGQGRHMIKGGAGGSHDIVFEPEFPESLLYEPDGSGGWRLGGAMYIIPIDLSPLPPPGFIGGEDPWHYHSSLCIWNNGGSVGENVSQSACLSRPGNPVWFDKAGWLVHLWNYVPNPNGRFVEVNDNF